MLKARLLLSLVAVTSILVFGWGIINSDRSSFLNGVAILIMPPVLLASLFMLVFSFFRVHQGADGQLVYDPANFYWKVLRKFYKSDWKDSISLCKAFWMTVFFILMVCGVTLISLGSVFVVGFLVYLIATHDLPALNLNSKQVATLISAVSLVIALYLTSVQHKSSKYLALALVAFGLGAVPIYMAGMIEWLKVVGVLVGVVTGACLLMLAVGWTFTKLASSDNLLKRFITVIKDGLCPILTARSS